MRRVKLGRCLDTLPERLALATTGGLGHAEFLELVLADEVTRREPAPPSLRARTAGLDPAMTLDRWDDTAKITYDHTIWNELCSLRFVESGHNARHPGTGRGRQNVPRHRARPRRHPPPLQRPLRTLRPAPQTTPRQSRLDNSHDTEIRKLLRVDLLHHR